VLRKMIERGKGGWEIAGVSRGACVCVCVCVFVRFARCLEAPWTVWCLKLSLCGFPCHSPHGDYVHVAISIVEITSLISLLF
jgi:hypothetical protein